MKYYKMIENGVITLIGSGSSVHETQTEITKEEYDSLMVVIQDKPVDTFESVYYLAESGIYEPRERTREEIIEWYANMVQIGMITLEDVPEEYRSEVESQLPEPTPELYTLDEASEIISQEVSK
jgi:hypothetical protein